MLRLNFSWSDNSLRITTLNEQHTGHEISADSYSKFSSKVRRPSPGLTPERPLMIATAATDTKKKSRQPKKQRHSTISNSSCIEQTQLLHEQSNNHHSARLSLPLISNNNSNPQSTMMIKTDGDIPKENKTTPSTTSFTQMSLNNNRWLPLLQGMLGGMLPIPSTTRQTTTINSTPTTTTAPLDLSASATMTIGNGLPFDRRSDDERFQEMHATLQAFADHLLHCRGMEFDAKLKQMRLILKLWDGRRDFF